MIKYLTIFVLLTVVAVSATASDSLEVLIARGGKGMLDKDYDKAIQNYLQALQIDPRNYEATKNLGLAYSASGTQDKALQYFSAHKEALLRLPALATEAKP